MHGKMAKAGYIGTNKSGPAGTVTVKSLRQRRKARTRPDRDGGLMSFHVLNVLNVLGSIACIDDWYRASPIDSSFEGMSTYYVQVPRSGKYCTFGVAIILYDIIPVLGAAASDSGSAMAKQAKLQAHVSVVPSCCCPFNPVLRTRTETIRRTKNRMGGGK